MKGRDFGYNDSYESFDRVDPLIRPFLACFHVHLNANALI